METTSYEFALPENYTAFSPVSAEIFVQNTNRSFAVDTVFLKALQQSFARLYAAHDQDALYRTGVQWGNSVYAKIETLALTMHPDAKSIREIPMPDFHRLFTNHLAALGWGNFELKRRDDFLFVDLYHSLWVEMLQSQTHDSKPHTSCALYAGFFAGIFSRISNMPLACIEITCKNEGYEHCSFLLDNEETIAMVKARISGKTTPLDAFEKVKKEFEG
ncbi:hypothetical protein L6Q79_09545 [bacterium]|nr:hypothetical protein [bacterium]NUN45252.1 hypothetical protein [bacterium]